MVCDARTKGGFLLLKSVWWEGSGGGGQRFEFVHRILPSRAPGNWKSCRSHGSLTMRYRYVYLYALVSISEREIGKGISLKFEVWATWTGQDYQNIVLEMRYPLSRTIDHPSFQLYFVYLFWCKNVQSFFWICVYLAWKL